MTHELKKSPKIEDLGEITRGRDEDFTLVVGPMYSRKSAYLIENFYGNEDVEAFKPILDNRDGANIHSRAYPKLSIPCTMISNPMDMTKSKAMIVIADEYQFLGSPETLTDAVIELKKQGKKVVFAGLDTKHDKTLWANYQAMRELCNREIQLTSHCTICNKPARFTSLISGEKNKSVQIESEKVRYEPRCNQHYQ